MKTLCRLNIIILCLLFTAGITFAQDTPVIPAAPADANANPDRWRGLVIDEATPDDAIRTLGKPDADKTDRIRAYEIDKKWLTKKIEAKTYRLLEFKKLDGFDQVLLAFMDDRLALVQLNFDENVRAAALSRIYGIEFMPRIGGFEQATRPWDYERNQGRVYPKTFPAAYYLVGVTENVFIGAAILNGFFSTVAKKTLMIRDSGDFPGKALRIQIFSRRLENKDGADLLK